MAVNVGFLDPEQLLFHSSNFSVNSSGGVDPVPDFSENLVAPGIEPGISGSVTRNSHH
jgi:hypothetical protein